MVRLMTNSIAIYRRVSAALLLLGTLCSATLHAEIVTVSNSYTSFGAALAPRDLIWPVEFENLAQNSIGFGLAQFQSNWAYKEYFHGGCDLVAKKDSDVRAPVSGRIEGGYYSYSYVDGGNGYLKKYWIPLEESAGKEVNKDYFEIAIVTEDGFRFELHHIDPRNIEPLIKQLILEKKQVSAGQKIGTVKEFPYQIQKHDYNHIHYNVIGPGGQRINCEWVSKKLSDDTAPEILGVFAQVGDQYIQVARGEKLTQRPREFLVEALDRKTGSFFPQQPAVVQLHFSSGTGKVWNFRYAIEDEAGLPPKISDVYKFEFQDVGGVKRVTQGDQDGVRLFFRLQVPEGAAGDFEISVEDFAGNRTEFRGSLSLGQVKQEARQ